MAKIKTYYNKLKKVKHNSRSEYISYCELPIDPKLVLLEGGQGGNINGNMFSMLKELKVNPRWREYKTVFVVTENTLEKAQSRMGFYGFSDVVLVKRDTKSYCKYLATAGYIMTDNSFPPYFNKRDGQVFFNTWHGTPLKTLGLSNKSSLASLANVQKNYLMSDYALFPNEFTRNVFMDDYALRPIFKGKSLIANYPRNYIFYDSEAGAALKEKLGLSGKRVYAYMPTWRDAATQKQKVEQLRITEDILRSFEEKMDDNTVLLVNLHFLLASEINCDGFEKVKYFSPDYDTYEILNACDGLITDYSSVFFDFAVTGKNVILFAYDKEEYLSSRGLYMPFESLPFPIVETPDEVISLMDKSCTATEEFLKEFCPNGSKDSCCQLMELLVSGESEVFTAEETPEAGENICLIYGGGLNFAHFDGMKHYICQNPNRKYVICYRKNLTQTKRDIIAEMGENVTTYGLLSAFQFKFKELLIYVLFSLLSLVKTSKALNGLYIREARRFFYSFEPVEVVDFSNGNRLISGILSALTGTKKYILHGDFYCTKKRAKKKINHSMAIEALRGFEAVDYKEIENNLYLEKEQEKAEDGDISENAAHSSFRKASKMKNILPVFYNCGGYLKLVSLFSFKTPIPTSLCDCVIKVGENTYDYSFLAPKSKKSTKHFGIYTLKIPMSEAINFPATSNVTVSYKNHLGLWVQCHTVYFAPLGNMFLGLRGPMNVDEETQTVAIFRQSKRNRLNVYVRSVNVTDKFSHRIKQLFAYIVAFLWHTEKAKKLVLLYEKNSSKYEESASVLYEELIDSGNENAYFIVTRDYEFLDRVPEKYRKNLVYKYTFKHYLYFFKSKTFIGTEAIAHAIDLKTFNVLALSKVGSKNLNYVFLQHGVMYMVSLDSESRGMFSRKRLNGKYRVVVSSQAESDHFTTLGRHLEEDIYITGLPKFDRNQYNENADKIVIMPTWRPWEINTARTDFTDTPYFKMIMRIYESVPEALKDKVIILPHPLILNELSKLSGSVSEKMVIDARYDDILKDTAVLITDYSSIAYDAFYRGARVVFYWEEKDYCMSQYGPSTKLMLNEKNVFGDYCYSTDGLGDIIEKNFKNPQTDEQKEKYSYLVNFHDNKNTQRLIDFLKRDGII